jgi:Gpi18-like mannosyltransferase
MSMQNGRKLKIAVLLAVILSVGISFYSIWNVRGDSTFTSTNRLQQAFHPGAVAKPGDNRTLANEMPSGGNRAPLGRNHADRHTSGMPFPGGNRFVGVTNASSGYEWPLAVYTAVFFVLSAAGYFFVFRKNAQIQAKDKTWLIGGILGVGLLLRIAVAPWIPGHPFDIQLFKSWAISAANNLTGFYLHTSSDYPPFYVYILYGIGKLASVPALSPYLTLLIKIPSILADVATAGLLYMAARKSMSFETGLMIAAFYTWNPAVLINSTFWGQVDSFFTLLVVAAVVFLSQSRIVGSSVLMTAAVLMKPQGIIYLPVFFFELIQGKRLKSWIIAAASALVTALILAAPFSIGQDPLWLFKLYKGTVNEYPFASVNAFNFFSLLGANYKSDSATWFLFSYRTWGLIFIVAVTLFSGWMYRKGGHARSASFAALLQIAGVFTFSTSMHERYLFPAAALALLAFAQWRDKRFLWLSFGFSLTIFVNTFSILYHSTRGAASYTATLFVISLLNVLLFAFLAKVVWDVCSLRTEAPDKPMASGVSSFH